MNEAARRAACVLAAALFSLALWATAPALVGTREPWDAAQPLYYPAAMLLGGVALGLVFPRHLFSAYLGLWLGQVVAFLTLPDHDRGWALLGMFTTAIGSLPGLLGFVLGALLHLVLLRLGVVRAKDEPASVWTQRARSTVLLLCWLPLPLRAAAAMQPGAGWGAIAIEFVVLWASVAVSVVLTALGVALLLRTARLRQSDAPLALCTLIAALVGVHALLA